jgi:hypothetical protein
MVTDHSSNIDDSADALRVTAREPPPGVRGALLVGSMPLVDSAAVFKFAEQQLGSHLKRIPDGETGSRINFTQWQQDIFAAIPSLTSEMFRRELRAKTVTLLIQLCKRSGAMR